MQLPVFYAKNPIVGEDGIVWDRYWLVQLIISSDVVNAIPSLYAEFWPSRSYIDGEGNRQNIIKRDLGGSEVKSITIPDIFSVASTDEQSAQVIIGVMAIVNQFGILSGFLKSNE